MMKSYWNEERVEELLRQLPAVRDHRSPEAIYRNIETGKPYRKKPARSWIGPPQPASARVHRSDYISSPDDKQICR